MAQLKPFTNYNCVNGCGKYSVYTGSYQHPKPTDDHCSCGALLTEDKSDGYLYRVEFEMVDPNYAAQMEEIHGKDVWPGLPDELWKSLPWLPVRREDFSEHSIRQQYNNLLDSATTHSQPIRKVMITRSKVGQWEDIG